MPERRGPTPGLRLPKHVYVNVRRSQGLLPPPSCHPVLCPMYRMSGSSTQFVRHNLSMYSQYSPIYSHKLLLDCSYEFCTCQGLNKFPMFVIVSSRVLLSWAFGMQGSPGTLQPRPDPSPAFAPRIRTRKPETLCEFELPLQCQRWRASSLPICLHAGLVYLWCNSVRTNTESA